MEEECANNSCCFEIIPFSLFSYLFLSLSLHMCVCGCVCGYLCICRSPVLDLVLYCVVKQFKREVINRRVSPELFLICLCQRVHIIVCKSGRFGCLHGLIHFLFFSFIFLHFFFYFFSVPSRHCFACNVACVNFSDGIMSFKKRHTTDKQTNIHLQRR